MKKRTKGAWLLHHGRKLQATTTQEFDAIAFASKCGTLLSAISAEHQAQISESRLQALAKANQISPRTELPAIVSELARQKLLNPGVGAVEVLGVTLEGVLEHTSTIFEEADHQPEEDAVIVVSELASEAPVTDKDVAEYMGDKCQLAAPDAANTIQLGITIGFFDAEKISPQERLLFNGNLFRRNEAKKINAVMSSLKPAEAQLLKEVNERLERTGCLPLESVQRVLGADLFKRLHSIGLFDVSVVGNESGKNHFVTRPAAFSKFSNSIADDALDLAKALVASLTYGMTVSSYSRGRIQMVRALMEKLIRGGTVGPATAIGNDYQALEHRGVVNVTPVDGGMFTMRLLKPEVGRLALAVIAEGDITSESVVQLPGAKVTEYVNPETTREIVRKQATDVRLKARELLNEIRTGGLTK